MSNPQQTLEFLRRKVKEMESQCHFPGDVLSTGNPDLDKFVGGGFRQGSLVEWVDATGGGASTLAFLASRGASQENKNIIVVDDQGIFYPPAAVNLGVKLSQVIILRPRSRPDFHWSLLQSLRSPGVAIVVTWLEKTHERMLRRLQLAAEQGGVVGFLIRPLCVLQEPSWSHTRLLVVPQKSAERTRCWRITLLENQQREMQFEMNDETGNLQQASPVPVATPLATPTPLQDAS